MRSIIVLSALCSLAPAFEFPNFVPIEKRQEPGTPQYDCHANCGGVISGARQTGYCTDPTWNAQFNACMDCALEYDIWQYYGSSVSRAATSCGLTATPKSTDETGSGSSSSSDAVVSSTVAATVTSVTATPTTFQVSASSTTSHSSTISSTTSQVSVLSAPGPVTIPTSSVTCVHSCYQCQFFFNIEYKCYRSPRAFDKYQSDSFNHLVSRQRVAIY